jgi:hypothetical protein
MTWTQRLHHKYLHLHYTQGKAFEVFRSSMTRPVPQIACLGFLCGWVGHVYAQKRKGPGTKRFAFIHFLPSGMHSTQKALGAPVRYQAIFLIALKLFIFSDWLYK